MLFTLFQGVKICKYLNYKELRKKKDFSQEEMADFLGLSASAYQSQEYETAKPRGTLIKLTRLLFWKELAIPRAEILKELRLNEGLAAVNEPPENYTPQTEAERYYYERWQEVEKRAQIYTETIELLRDKVRRLEGK